MSDRQVLNFGDYVAARDRPSLMSEQTTRRFNWAAAISVAFCAAFWFIAAAIMGAAF